MINPGIAIEFCSTIFPFNSISSNKTFLAGCASSDNKIMQRKDRKSDHNSSLLLKPSPNFGPLVSQFNNALSKNNNDLENISSSKYFDIDEIHNIKIPRKNKSLFLFHISACLVNKNFDELQNFL